jgi:signal transduction histidine kinase
MTSELSLDALRRELLDRLAHTEQRTLTLEAMLRGSDRLDFEEAPPEETPRPPRTLKRTANPPHEAVLGAVVSSLDEVIWSTSPDGERVYVLAGGVEGLLGRPAQEFLERPRLWLEIVPENERAAFREAFRQLLAAGTVEFEHPIETPAGTIRRLRSRARLIRANDGAPLRVDGIATACSTRGCADRGEDRIRELESRLAAAAARSQEAGRLEAVGRLLAGAAHDFNNLLTIVTGNAELVREQLMFDDPLRESLELIASSGHTAARLARQLIAYAKPPEGTPGTFDPNLALRGCEPVLRRFASPEIELDFLLTPGISPIRANRSEFDRVVLNLVMNARDAIEEAGVIALRTASVSVSAERRGWPSDCPPGEYVAVTVTDTGCGMTEEVKARAFTRFFTTKGVKGTGLGLATVQDIVTAAGGHIELESSPEWGTSVRIFWPAAVDSPPNHES